MTKTAFKDVNLIHLTGDLLTTGVFTFNSTGPKGAFFKKHKYAKQGKNGLDYTSQRSIRRQLFKQEINRQATKENANKQYISLAASPLGILRGLMDPDGDRSRDTPIQLLDAWTSVDKNNLKTRQETAKEDGKETEAKYSLLFQDIGTSTKPKETKSEENLNSDGELSGDTSLFSSDNAPPRIQDLDCTISISNLMWIDLDPNSRSLVRGDKDIEEFKKKLAEYFDDIGVESELNDGDFTYGVTTIKTRGILLSDEQTRALVADVISRFEKLHGAKLGASIRALPASFKIKINHSQESGTILDLGEFKEALKSMTFKSGWKKSS
jgi:hypothetical protein